jgi:hypothetical protein
VQQRYECVAMQRTPSQGMDVIIQAAAAAAPAAAAATVNSTSTGAVRMDICMQHSSTRWQCMPNLHNGIPLIKSSSSQYCCAACICFVRAAPVAFECLCCSGVLLCCGLFAMLIVPRT